MDVHSGHREGDFPRVVTVNVSRTPFSGQHAEAISGLYFSATVYHSIAILCLEASQLCLL